VWTFKHIQFVWIGAHWLAMSNCCYNPIVYCWMNSKFRQGFKYVLRWCPCVHYNVDQKSDANQMTRMHMSYVSTVRPSVPQSPYSTHLRQNLLPKSAGGCGGGSAQAKVLQAKANGFSNGKNRGCSRARDSSPYEKAPLNSGADSD
jgi:hypothetical protein